MKTMIGVRYTTHYVFLNDSCLQKKYKKWRFSYSTLTTELKISNQERTPRKDKSDVVRQRYIKMESRIEQAIQAMEIYISECNPQMLNKSNIVVNREEIEEYLSELKRHVPDEVKKYKKVLANKDAILEDARKKADEIIKAANIQFQEILSEQEIMKQAYASANAVVETATAQAQEILEKATNDANEIRTGAIQYTDGILANVQQALEGTMNTYQANYATLLNDLAQYHGIVIENRKELVPAEEVATGMSYAEE